MQAQALIRLAKGGVRLSYILPRFSLSLRWLWNSAELCFENSRALSREFYRSRHFIPSLQRGLSALDHIGIITRRWRRLWVVRGEPPHSLKLGRCLLGGAASFDCLDNLDFLLYTRGTVLEARYLLLHVSQSLVAPARFF